MAFFGLGNMETYTECVTSRVYHRIDHVNASGVNTSHRWVGMERCGHANPEKEILRRIHHELHIERINLRDR